MATVFQFRKLQVIPISQGAAWGFFSDPGNLPAITPPALGFRMLSQAPARVYPGLMLLYSVRPFPGFRTTWVSEITQVRAPEFFVDEQRLGPYALWHHEHHFRRPPEGIGRALGKPGVEMEDRIHYALPFGPLGALLGAALVRRQLEAIFAYRSRVLVSRFGTA